MKNIISFSIILQREHLFSAERRNVSIESIFHYCIKGNNSKINYCMFCDYLLLDHKFHWLLVHFDWNLIITWKKTMVSNEIDWYSLFLITCGKIVTSMDTCRLWFWYECKLNWFFLQKLIWLTKLSHYLTKLGMVWRIENLGISFCVWRRRDCADMSWSDCACAAYI